MDRHVNQWLFGEVHPMMVVLDIFHVFLFCAAGAIPAVFVTIMQERVLKAETGDLVFLSHGVGLFSSFALAIFIPGEMDINGRIWHLGTMAVTYFIFVIRTLQKRSR